jgi:thiamine-phosphate pyrophosphorylase
MTPAEHAAALRAIDANFNRAVEGIRVVEDQARFALNDAQLSRECKHLRHGLTAAMAQLDPAGQRVVFRDTLADVGTTISVPAEGERATVPDLVAANFQRVSQALRVIEEGAKLIGQGGEAFESLRYRSYTLAKAFHLRLQGQAVWAGRQLYVLIDGRAQEADFVTLVEQLIAAGVHVIQLRDKQRDDRTLLARGRLLRQLIDEQTTGDRKPLFIMNDRPDLALLTRADGVHVGQEELPVGEVRKVVGATMQIGVSTHTIEQARLAVLEGANYLGCGPTFPSGTKQFESFPGIPFLQQVAAEISLPCFAIGGITTENLSQVQAAGFSRVAVSGAVQDSQDPGAAIVALREQLQIR